MYGNFKENDIPRTRYELRIKTGSQDGSASSTNPDAYVKINGVDQNGIKTQSKRINLVFAEDQDRFDKDGVNSFKFENVDVGVIESIELGVRNQEEKWFVEFVELYLPLKPKTLVFQVNNWYCKTEGDGLLTRSFDANGKLN